MPPVHHRELIQCIVTPGGVQQLESIRRGKGFSRHIPVTSRTGQGVSPPPGRPSAATPLCVSTGTADPTRGAFSFGTQGQGQAAKASTEPLLLVRCGQEFAVTGSPKPAPKGPQAASSPLCPRGTYRRLQPDGQSPCKLQGMVFPPKEAHSPVLHGAALLQARLPLCSRLLSSCQTTQHTFSIRSR